NEPRQQERKLGARLVRAREPARLSQPAATPNRAVGANDSTHPDSSLRIIHLFGAAGVLVPLIIMPLEQGLTLHIGSDRVLGVLRILIWPASVLTIGMQGPIFTSVTFF